MFVAIPFDQQVTDTYFVVAHFHYIIFGAAVFPIFGGMYYWFPKVTGKLYFERPGQISFWIIFVGTNLLFFPMHIVGLLGMPRRVYTYPDGLGWTAYNLAETIGGFVTLAGILLLLGNLFVSYFRGARGRARSVARRRRSSGRRARRRRSTTSRSSRRCRAPTRTGTTPTARRTAASWPTACWCSSDGHEQPAVTPVDARFDEVVEMPHESPWPPILRARALARLRWCS